MRLRLFAVPIAVLVLVLPAVASAQDAAAGEVRRDPQGIKGISPFWELVNKGDAAYVARNFDVAIAAYQEALSSEPQNALGHYRMGEAYLAKNNFDLAETAWQAALRFAVHDPRLRAKILFVLADLRERRQQLQEAKDGWSTYEANLQGQSEQVGYPHTPAERKKRIDVWVDMKEKYESVKQRILKRLAEVDAKKRKDAK